MKILLPLLALALAGPAVAEDPPKSEAAKPKPALNLRLDDSTSAAPRVTFGPTPATQTKEEREKGLPDLGGKPNQAYTRQVSPSGVNSTTSNSVIPSAMDPSVNR